jgi:hypothetical protein
VFRLQAVWASQWVGVYDNVLPALAQCEEETPEPSVASVITEAAIGLYTMLPGTYI